VKLCEFREQTPAILIEMVDGEAWVVEEVAKGEYERVTVIPLDVLRDLVPMDSAARDLASTL